MQHFVSSLHYIFILFDVSSLHYILILFEVWSGQIWDNCSYSICSLLFCGARYWLILVLACSFWSVALPCHIPHPLSSIATCRHFLSRCHLTASIYFGRTRSEAGFGLRSTFCIPGIHYVDFFLAPACGWCGENTVCLLQLTLYQGSLPSL